MAAVVMDEVVRALESLQFGWFLARVVVVGASNG